MISETINAKKRAIERLVHDLYPAIQHQFILISSNFNLSNSEDGPFQKVYDLLNDLKAEFHSLITYENKLVFPSVLKVSENLSQNGYQPLPNIEALQKLTESKEHRLLQLTNALADELEASDLKKTDYSIMELIRLFKYDFSEQKSKWNQMILTP